MLAITSNGTIHTQLLSGESADGGPLVLREQLVCSADLRGRVGCALHYSLPCRLLFAAYADGRCFGLKINNEATEVCGGFALHSTRADPQTGGSAVTAAVASKGLAAQHFQDVPGARGLLLATSRKTLMPLAIRIAPSSVSVQLVRQPSLGFAAAREVAPASPPVCWFLAEDGSLHCYEGGSVSSGSGSDGGGGGAGAEAMLHEKEVAGGIAAAFAKRSQTKLPSFPVDFFERAHCVSQQGDDIGFSSSSIAEGPAELRGFDATAKTRLSSSSEDYVTSLNKSTVLDLVVHNSNHTSVVVGVRVLLGNAQLSAIPATITLFGRSVVTQESQRRWYDLPFTPAESVVGAKQFNLLFSSAHSGVGPAVDAVEVYAQSKAEFGWNAQLSALALKYVPHRARGAATQAHSADPSAPHATLLRALQAALQQLETFHRLASAGVGIGVAAPVRDDMLRSLPLTFTTTSNLALLRRPAKQLLRLLQPDPSSYHELKDTAQLRYALACVSGGTSADGDTMDKGTTAPPLTLLLLEQQAGVLKKLAKKRPQHLLGFLQRHPQFLPDFCGAFRELGVRGHPTQLTHSLVQLLYDLAQHAVGTAGVDATEAEQLHAMQPAFNLLIGMLLCGTEAVRFTTSAALSRLLLSVTVDAPAPAIASGAAKQECTSGAEMDLDEDEAAVPTEINAAVGAVQFCCDVCGVCPIVESRWHCAICKDFDLCAACYDAGKLTPLPPHTLDHPLSRIRIAGTEPAEGDDTEGDDNAEGDDTEGDNTEGDELTSFINDDTPAQPEAAIDSDCENEMLAMAVAMSLGKEPIKASDAPPRAKSPPQMAMRFLELMTQHLPQLTSHDGLGVLPYLQLLQLLATQHAAGVGAKQWVRLANAILAVVSPVKEPIAVDKRTPRLELHTLLLMLLGLLLHKESRAAAASVPEVEQLDVRALQTELVAQLRAAGLGELLYAHALKLFNHFKQAGQKERSNETAGGTPGCINAQVHAGLAWAALPAICPRCGRHLAPPAHAPLAHVPPAHASPACYLSFASS